MALALCAMMLAIGGQLAVPDVVGTFHDDGVYLSTAKALAEGDGYRLISFPGEPWQTKYPILFPLVLSAIWLVYPKFPDNIQALEMVPIACAGLFVGIAYLYLVRFSYGSRPAVILSILLCMSIPGFSFFSGQLLSEMPFALSLVAALWHLDSYLETRPTSLKSKMLLGVSLSLPFLIRSIGLAVPVGALIALCLHRAAFKWTAAVLIIVTFIGFGLPTIYGLKTSHEKQDKVQAYQTSYLSWWDKYGLSQELSVIAVNLKELTGVTGKSSMSGIIQSREAAPYRMFLDWICILIGAAPWLLLLRRQFRTRAMSLVLFSYAAIVLLWPWPPFRFMMPILPFLCTMTIEPFCRLTRRSLPAGALSSIGFALLVITNAWVLAETLTFSKSSKIPVMKAPQERLSWSSFIEIFAWIKSNTSATDNMASTYDALMYMYTGRKCVRMYELDMAAAFYGKKAPPLGSVDDLITLLKRYQIRYLVITPMPNYAEEKMIFQLAEKLEKDHPEQVHTQFTGTDPRFKVMSIEGL